MDWDWYGVDKDMLFRAVGRYRAASPELDLAINLDHPYMDLVHYDE